MYDKEKVLLGIVIFLALFTLPIWYSQITGDADAEPYVEIAPEAGAQCVESADYMRAKHMDLLDEWREDVVRGADREYESDTYPGVIYDKSLTDTCLEQCHTNKSEFCDSCHGYVDVRPKCWECHNIVEGD